MSLPYTDTIVAINAVSSTTTSAPIDVSKRQLKSIQFTSANTAGSAIFTVYVSNDGTNFVLYNRLTDNVVNAIGEGDVRVAASSSLATNTSNIYFFPAGDYFRYMEVVCTVTTGGIYSAIIECAG